MNSMEENYDYFTEIVQMVQNSEKIKDVFLGKLLEDNPDGEFKITIEDVDYNFSLRDIINYITINDDSDYFHASYIYSPSPDIPPSYFRYAVLQYFLKLQEKEYDERVGERIDELSNDRELKLMNQFYKPNDPNLEKVEVNPKLQEAVFKGYKLMEMPIFDALYIYIKLCQLLTYDETFFVVNQQGDYATAHENIEHIYDITPENNKVVCYEFAAILEKLLISINIPAQLVKKAGDITRYGVDHTYVQFKALGHIITLDSTTSILGSDLFAAKMKLNLSGINWFIPGSDDRKEQLITSRLINHIYAKIDGRKLGDSHVGLEDLLDEYKSLTDKFTDISLKDKVDILTNMVNSTRLIGTDAYAYLLYLKHNLLGYVPNLNISIIRDSTNDVPTARAIVTIKSKDEEEQQVVHYYSYVPNQPLTPICLEDLQLMFDKKLLGYIGENKAHRIEGIKVR